MLFFDSSVPFKPAVVVPRSQLYRQKVSSPCQPCKSTSLVKRWVLSTWTPGTSDCHGRRLFLLPNGNLGVESHRTSTGRVCPIDRVGKRREVMTRNQAETGDGFKRSSCIPIYRAVFMGCNSPTTRDTCCIYTSSAWTSRGRKFQRNKLEVKTICL